jgi:hypothetical protein
MPRIPAVLVVAALLITGCQQPAVKTGAQEAPSDDFSMCLKKARAAAGSEGIGKAKVIQNENDPLYDLKLKDATYAKPKEAEAALRYAIARRPCLARHIERLGEIDTELAVLRSEAAAASDQDMIDLAAGAITWGELNRRERKRSKQVRSMVDDISQRVSARSGQQQPAETKADQQAEQQRQQKVNQALQSWTNKQLAINAMRPESSTVTDCVMSDSRITCRSR